jgi:hypothetical protein
MVDYTKWDIVGDSDDEQDGHGDMEHIASKNPGQALNVLLQQEAYIKACKWLREAAPTLSETHTTHLLRYMAVQDKATCPDADERHAAILKFLAEVYPWTPPLDALLALCHHAEAHTNAEADEQAQLSNARVMLLAMASLNTASACAREGGAQAFFDTLRAEPEGDVARQFADFRYARELVRGAAKPRHAKPSPELAMKPSETEVEEEPLPPFPTKKYRPPPVERAWWQILASNLWFQFSIVAFAFVSRRVFDRYYAQADGAAGL